MNQLVQTQAPSPDSQRGENLQSTDLNVLQEIQEEFGRRLGPAIAATLHCDVSASVKGICQQTYAEFHRGLTSPYVFPVAFPPEKGAAALNLSSGLIFPMLEVMMGGRSRSRVTIAGRGAGSDQILEVSRRDPVQPAAPEVSECQPAARSGDCHHYVDELGVRQGRLGIHEYCLTSGLTARDASLRWR